MGVRAHVIRFWEEKFPQIKTEIGKGDRRYYFDAQMEVLQKIKSMLHDEGYTIAGLQKLLKKRKNSDEKKFEIDDFIKEETDDLGAGQKNEIKQILIRIEENLKKL